MHPRFLRSSLLALLLFTGCDSSETPTRFREPTGRPNILLVTLDTTRADALGCYGNSSAQTPNLDALAARGRLFERAYTPAPITLPAHTSLHTGSHPVQHGVRVNGSFALDAGRATLAETLGKADYQTAAVVGAFPLMARFGLDRGFDSYDDRFPLVTLLGQATVRHHERKAPQVVDEALRWLNSRDPVRPWFLWAHFFDPHDPYEAPAPFDRGNLAQRYQGEVDFVDRELGRLFRFVDDQGLRENTVVIVAGDHGEALGGHGEQTHSYFIYDETLHVPLILAVPGVDPGRVSGGVSLIDVFPTVAQVLGLAGPDTEGRSLITTGNAPRSLYAETQFPAHEFGFAPLFSLRSGDWKFIHAPTPELYQISEDPAEASNVAREHPDIVASLRTRLEATLTRDVGGSSATPDDPKIRERLASLGYARLGAPVGSGGSGAHPDPKAMLKLYLRLRQATALGRTGRLEESIRLLDELEDSFDGSFVFHLELGGLHYQTSERARLAAQAGAANAHRESARRHFGRVLEIEPDHVNTNLNQGNLAFASKAYGEALPFYERVVAVDPQKWEAYVPLTVCWVQTGGEPLRAMQLIEKALSLDLPPFERARAETLLETLQKRLEPPPRPPSKRE